MQYVRESLLTLACIAILSTAAMADSMSGQKATPTDPMGVGSPSQGMGSPSGGESITGEILSVQGEMYTVKDSTGKEVQLHVDDSTQKSGKLKEGDQIEAEITPDGHVLKVKKAKAMQ